MAIYEGPGQLSGRIGNLIFRRGENGKTIVYQYSPPKKKKKNPGFAAAIHASKLFRESLGEYYDFYGSPEITKKLTGAFSKILSANKRPQKDKCLSMEFGRGPLMGFQICKRGKNGLLASNFHCSEDGKWLEMQYHTQDLNHQLYQLPNFITHVQPLFLAVPLPDWKYNGRRKEYLPTVANPNPQIFFPAECPVWKREETIGGQSVVIELPFDKWPKEHGLVILHGMLPVYEHNELLSHSITHASIEIIEVIY